MDSLICSFYLTVAARDDLLADPSVRCTWLVCGTLRNPETKRFSGELKCCEGNQWVVCPAPYDS